MWPLHFNASCLLLVLDEIGASSSLDQQQAIINQYVSLCLKTVQATRTMVDFAPTTQSAGQMTTSTSASNNNTNITSTDEHGSQQQQQRNNSSSGDFSSSSERPAGAVYAVISSSSSTARDDNNNNNNNSSCTCLWSPIGDGDDDQESIRSGDRIAKTIRERLVKLFTSTNNNDNTNSNRNSSASSSSSAAPSTLEALIRCTGVVRHLAQGNVDSGRKISNVINGDSPSSSSLIRIITSSSLTMNTNSTSSGGDRADESSANNRSNSHSSLISWKDSICSLISTWENLNVKVSIEFHQKQKKNNEFLRPSCQVLQYLMGVSSSSNSSSTFQEEKMKTENDEQAFQLTFVCPKCRAMIVNDDEGGRNSNSSSTKKIGGMLAVIALQEPPRCPRGCTTL